MGFRSRSRRRSSHVVTPSSRRADYRKSGVTRDPPPPARPGGWFEAATARNRPEMAAGELLGLGYARCGCRARPCQCLLCNFFAASVRWVPTGQSSSLRAFYRSCNGRTLERRPAHRHLTIVLARKAAGAVGAAASRKVLLRASPQTDASRTARVL
jgi:hypothetical protein